MKKITSFLLLLMLLLGGISSAATIESYTNLTTPDGLEEVVVSDVTNSNATRNIQAQVLIEDRHLTKSVAGSSDVALTAAESLHGQITFTGELTGDINVTVPDNRERAYIIYNNTTGAFSLTFKTVSGTGVEPIRGDRQVISSDGTNVSSTVTTTPSGFTGMWSGTVATIPSGWALCDGSAVSRTTYAALFAALGTVHGVGDGSTTFNLPNLTDRFVIHADADAAGTRNVGDTGGSFDAHGHTAPNHDHQLPFGAVGTDLVTDLGATFGTGGNFSYTRTTGGLASLSGSTLMLKSHTDGDDATSTTAVIPKFYALAYIVKL